jgi:O-antigen/teichoic acid export membrane protein
MNKRETIVDSQIIDADSVVIKDLAGLIISDDDSSVTVINKDIETNRINIESLDKKSDKNLIAALIVGKALAVVATFAMPVILTRFLSKGDYGIYAQFYNILTFLIGFFCFGIPGSLYYFYPNATIEKKKTIVFQTWVLLCLITLLSSCIFLISFISERLIGSDLMIFRNILICTLILSIPSVIIEPLYVLKSDRIVSIIFPPLTVLSKLLAVIVFIQIVNSLNNVLQAVLVSQIFIFILVLWYVGKELKLKNFKLPKIDFKILKQQLHYIIPFGISGSISSLLGRFDKIVCITFLSATEYATYSVAFFGIPAVNQIYDSFAQVYVIKLTKAWQNSDRKQMLTIFNDLVSKTYSYTIPLILAFFLYAPKIVQLIFTEKYLDAVPLFRIYILSFFFVLLGSNLVLRASGKTKEILISYLISCVIAIPVTYILIKKIGLYGAMSGAILCMIVPKFFMMFYEIRILGCNLKQYLHWRNMIKIFNISFLVIIPFIIVELKLHTSIPLTILFGLIYVLIVSSIEIKYDLFVFSYDDLKYRMRKILKLY